MSWEPRLCPEMALWGGSAGWIQPWPGGLTEQANAWLARTGK